MAGKSVFKIEFQALTGALERGFKKAGHESDQLSKKLDHTKAKSLDVREATLKVEQAQQRATRAAERYGKESLQAASAQVRLERAQQKAAHTTGDLDKKTHRLSGHLGTAAKAAVGAAAAYVGLSAVKDAVHTTEELGKTTLQLHRSFGLSVESATQWAAVAKSRGIETQKMALSFKALSAQVYAASNGSKSAVKIFKDLGISQKDLRAAGGDTGKVLALVSDGLSRLPAGTEKTAISAKLLGRSWLTLNPLLKDGSTKLREQLQLADEYGATLSGKTVKDVQKAIVAQREHNLAMLGLKVAVGSAVLPYLTKAEHSLTKFIKGFRDGTGAGGRFKDELQKLKKPAQEVARFVGSLAKGVGNFIKEHPEVSKLAAEFAIIGGAAVKISKLTGAGSILKLGFGRGNTPLTPMFVKDVSGGISGAVGGKKAPPAVWAGGPVAATTFAAAANQSKTIGKGPLVATGAPNGGGPLLGPIRTAVASALGVAKAKPVDHRAFDKSLDEMNDAAKSIRRKVSKELGDKLSSSVEGTWERLGSSTDTTLSDIRSTVARTMKRISSLMDRDSAAGSDALRRNFTAGADAIQKQINRGKVSTASGMATIGRLFARTAAEFGISDPKTYRTWNTPASRATGGWIGNPGEAGGDVVPAMLGRGEAVLNRHQQTYVDSALVKTYGFDLDGLFSKVRKPHYLARGGRPESQRNSSRPTSGGGSSAPGQIGRMLSFAKGIAAHHWPYVYGGGHGSFNGPYDCSGYVSAILHAGGLLGSPLDTVALRSHLAPGPGIVTVGVRGGAGKSGHTMIKIGNQFFESGSGHGAAQVGGWSGNFDMYHPKGLKAPSIRRVRMRDGLGKLSVIGQAALDNARHAANQRLKSMFNRGGRPKLHKSKNHKYSISDLVALSAWGGFPASQIPVAASVAMAESGGSPGAVLVNSDQWRSRDRGLWQINDHWNANISDSRAFAPASAVKAALSIYKSRGWRDWVTYTKGTYAQYMPAARAAASRLRSSDTTGGGKRSGRLFGEGVRSVGKTPNALTPGDVYDRNYAQAQRTQGFDDDVAAAQSGMDYWRGVNDRAWARYKANPTHQNWSDVQHSGEQLSTWQGNWESSLSSRNEAMAQGQPTSSGSGGSSAEDRDQVLKEIRDGIADMNKRATAIGNSSDGALARAVTAVVTGQIGGRVGLGFSAGSYAAGTHARY